MPLTTPYQIPTWPLFRGVLAQWSLAPRAWEGGKNEGHVQLLLGYPLVCFKLPCLFGTSTETDVALPCRIIYCTSWCSMEGLPGPSWSVSGTGWCLLNYDNYKSRLQFFCCAVVILLNIYLWLHSYWAGGEAAGFCACMWQHRAVEAPLSVVNNNATHYFCRLMIIGMIAQSKSQPRLAHITGTGR